MSYNVELSGGAEKQLTALPKEDQVRLRDALLELAINPRAGDVKKLKGEHTGKYRRRVGSYRIVYEIQDKILLVFVIWIGQRGGAYK